MRVPRDLPGTIQGLFRDWPHRELLAGWGPHPHGRKDEQTSSFLCAPLLACILICSGQGIGRGQSLQSGHGSLSSAPWPSVRPFFAHRRSDDRDGHNTISPGTSADLPFGECWICPLKKRKESLGCFPHWSVASSLSGTNNFPHMPWLLAGVMFVCLARP